MEGLLDKVAEGKVAWKTVIENFYPDLEEAVKIAEKEQESVKIEDEVTDVICEEMTEYGDQAWTSRKISCLPRISGVPQYEALSGKDRSEMSQMWERYCP